MNELSDARRLVSALREARSPAPHGFIGRTLARLATERARTLDHYFETDSPLGRIFVAYGAAGITSIELATDRDDYERDYVRQFGRAVEWQAESGAPAALRRALGRRLAGERADVPVDLVGRTQFEREVLEMTMRIPHGEVRPYGWVAREIGRPRAVRAVGTALANNPVPLAIPCHRVVRSDGRIGEYGLGGPERKRRALRAEGLDPDELERLAGAGIRYLGSDTTHVFCLPSCSAARRITAAHRVPFRGASEALSAGYRACRLCRPVVTAAA